MHEIDFLSIVISKPNYSNSAILKLDIKQWL
jgi:hypothetical protein